MYKGTPNLSESLSSITCCLKNPLITSHHDLLLSSFLSHLVKCISLPQAVVAPRVLNTRVKVCWKEEGMTKYQSLLSSTLPYLQHILSPSSSPGLTSILLDTTNHALRCAAEESFHTIPLSSVPRQRPTTDPEIKAAQKTALARSRTLRSLISSPSSSLQEIATAIAAAATASSSLCSAIGMKSLQQAATRDRLLHDVLSSDPSKLYTAVSRAQNSSTPTTHILTVGTNSYTGAAVPDGFYSALTSLKVPYRNTFTSNPNFLTAASNLNHILQLCQAGPAIPSATESETKKLLQRLRPEVKDFYAISAHH